MNGTDDSAPGAAPAELARLLGARPRGRGALSNRAGRFEAHDRAPVDDGWGASHACGDEIGGGSDALPPLRTEVRLERPRSVIARNTSPDLGFDRSVNPYRGCEHGCIYCFARPTHAWLGLSAGLDFETRLIARPDAPEVLRRQLSAPSYRPRLLAIGTNTDPYQPLEARLRIMRGLLEVLWSFRHPVGIVTKGSLIERDLDLLREFAGAGLVHVDVSVTTLDPALARKLEPRAPAPRRRLETIARLAAAGVPVRAMVAPVIPGLTDHEIEAILAACAEAGARAASWIVLRLPGEVASLFREWLEAQVPERAGKVMNRLREMHGGRDYDGRFGHRMRGEGVHAALLARRFAVTARRLGLDRPLPPPRLDLFRGARNGPGAGEQLSLF